MRMSDYNTYLQTAAAISSAIAAIAAVYVARSTFTFQRDSLLKKVVIEQIMKLLKQLYYLRSLTVQPVLAEADEEFLGLLQQISETRASVIALESLVSTPASADVKKVRDVVFGMRKENVYTQNHKTPNDALSAQLSDAISALYKIYHTEIK
jgi:hypothetical protein